MQPPEAQVAADPETVCSGAEGSEKKRKRIQPTMIAALDGSSGSSSSAPSFGGVVSSPTRVSSAVSTPSKPAAVEAVDLSGEHVALQSATPSAEDSTPSRQVPAVTPSPAAVAGIAMEGAGSGSAKKEKKRIAPTLVSVSAAPTGN